MGGGRALHILANTRTLAAQQAADNDPPPHTCSSEGPPLAASPSSSSTSSCGVVCGAANAASASASCCTACASHAAMPTGGRDGWQGTLQAWRARCGLIAAMIQAQTSLGEHLELMRRFRRPAQACNNSIPPGGCTRKRLRLAASKGPRCRSSQGTALGRRSCRGGGPSRKVAGAVHQLGVLCSKSLKAVWHTNFPECAGGGIHEPAGACRTPTLPAAGGAPAVAACRRRTRWAGLQTGLGGYTPEGGRAGSRLMVVGRAK